jgi:DNA-directed RNA polymerase specialized sigma24 family protein
MTETREERLLAAILLQLMKGSSQREKVLQLNAAGFSNVEVADLLGMKAGGVAQTLYEVKKATKTKRK